MPPTAAQRVEQLEEQCVTLRGSIAEEVTVAIGAAMKSLEEKVFGTLEWITKKFEEDLTSRSVRLEGRIDRYREEHEMMISQVKTNLSYILRFVPL